ncbi:alpha/beta hydrolase [Iamia majanohamensis]|uniref:Alpha/beta hydrolase n=1 Tax=Iamia majanohamensis TaxID=467976 RepID=A0AAE9Y527_9ACTN|nr:alpha/beta fold hydrolase [Iamia majanohamensis]WCO66800.1 alpha/beta hydrolase [Iamia majanohamensis]
MKRQRRVLAVLVVLAVALLGACRTNATVTVQTTTLGLPCGGGTTVGARWALPTDVAPRAVVYLQHGFARSAARVDDVARSIAARGLAVVSPDLSGFGSCAINESATRAAVADLLDGQGPDGLQASADRARAAAGLAPAPLPAAVVLAGHSAGGALVTAAAARLATDPSSAVRQRLRGVVLLDPVETSDRAMAAALPALRSTSVLTVSAPAGACNASGSGTAALVAARTGFAGVRLPTGCHCDAEADSTDALCTLVCGTPRAGNEAALKRLASDWADDMARGRRVDGEPYPGGGWFESQRGAGTVVALTGTA